MPEGHVIHRQARIQGDLLSGVPLVVTSPQGRFALGARALDGYRIEGVEAVGKHLFYTWDSGSILHVHLGLFGRFRLHGSEAPPPTNGTRLALQSPAHTLHLSGPTICKLIDVWKYKDIVSRLGPDPLGEVPTEEAITHLAVYLSRREAPIAEALLDQKVIAGVGNVYRSEILFLCGLNPLIASRELSVEQIEDLWTETRAQMSYGLEEGRIVTTHPRDAGVDRRSRIPPKKRTYVYKRRDQPCRRCGSPIARTEVAGRKVWWCPTCQPR